MNQTIQELYERKSVRAYEERPIEPEKKEMVKQKIAIVKKKMSV